MNQLDAGTEVAFIFNPFLNPIELMTKINKEFGIASKADSILGLTEELNLHLLHSAAHGKNCVLVIDEAQNLAPQVLEQIRLLSNLETDSEKLLQIILIGQPELAEKLALHELRQLNQRITARYHLKPLDALETLQYIAYRIHVAGGRKRINFTKRAVTLVYKYAGGVPRMINAICDRALLIGYTKEEHVITARIIRRAVREIRGEKAAARSRPRFTWRRLLPNPSMVALLLVILALAHFMLDPLDRFARELSVFNRILTGESAPAPRQEGERFTPQVTAETDFATEGAAESAAEATTPAGPLQRVMERLNEVNSAIPSQALAPILTGLDAAVAFRSGLDALVALWRREAEDINPEAPSVEAATAFFAAHGLACEHLRPAAQQLLAINLPGLVRMRDGESRIWMALLRADEETVTLAAEGARRVTATLSEFNQYYDGELLAPWNDPAPDASVLLPGQQGPKVASLKEQLRALKRLAADNISDVYDKETELAVKAIQTEAGLTADGKAGRQVRLALAGWTGDAPALRRGVKNAVAMNSRRAVGGNDNVSSSPKRELSKDVPKSSQVVAESSSVSEFLDKAIVTSNGAVSETIHTDVEDLQTETETSPPAYVSAPEDFAPITSTYVETPVMAAPMLESTEEEAAAPSSAGQRRLFRLLGLPAESSQEDNASHEQSAETLMEVRELPEPFAIEPLPEHHHAASSSVTPPVFGSAPLVPSEEGRL